ncbi:hypothetical protein GF336_02830 [Candidatus Woesearchaeota archaeon]|nr:hypothetical protein [Candidatus Woesearchaeota archaeon]
MRKIFLLLVLMSFVLAAGAMAAENESKSVDMVVFYGEGCPHCSQLKSFLDDVSDDYPELNVIEKEVYFDNKNRELFSLMVYRFDTEIQGVPTTFIDDKVIVGFSKAIGESIEQEIQRCIDAGCESPLEKIKQGAGSGNDTVHIVGESSPSEDPGKAAAVKRLTLPAVLSAAAVDAINPCAFAVLIILLTTVLGAGRKSKALYSGLAFTASIYISYLLMGIGLYSAVQAAGITHWFYAVVGILAIIIGLFNLKDYLWYGKWFKMEVPESWRPKMKMLIKGVTSVPGAFLIGFVVSLFLLPCTSGPYIVILGLLAKSSTREYAFLLLLLYNFIFILPMLIITLAVAFGFTTVQEAEEWRQKKLKVLHLIAGAIILLLGIGMLTALYFGWL